MPTEQDIAATMDVFQCDRADAITRLAPYESTDEDKEYAKFLVDLFDHHEFQYDQFERSFWRDNSVLAHSSHPQWSQRQRESVERMMNRYLPKMMRAVR